jgi:hypothetical protein
MPYVSVNPETKSVRERYIRVAAIDIVISEGTWNVYIANSRKKTGAFPSSRKNIQFLTRLIFQEEVSINNL